MAAASRVLITHCGGSQHCNAPCACATPTACCNIGAQRGRNAQRRGRRAAIQKILPELQPHGCALLHDSVHGSRMNKTLLQHGCFCALAAGKGQRRHHSIVATAPRTVGDTANSTRRARRNRATEMHTSPSLGTAQGRHFHGANREIERHADLIRARSSVRERQRRRNGHVAQHRHCTRQTSTCCRRRQL